jgi:hypothetical protein
LKDESFSIVFLLYESFITFLIFFFSECFIEAKGLVKFSKSVISRSNSFCKYILGLKKIACNISAKSELGRFPITDYIKTQAMLYFCRLQTDSINPLLKEAFSICKSVDSDGSFIER